MLIPDWTPISLETPLAELAGQTVVVSTPNPQLPKDVYVLQTNKSLEVTHGTLGSSKGPKRQATNPNSTIGSFVMEVAGIAAHQAMKVPAVRWAGAATAWAFFAPVLAFTLAVVFVVMLISLRIIGNSVWMMTLAGPAFALIAVLTQNDDKRTTMIMNGNDTVSKPAVLERLRTLELSSPPSDDNSALASAAADRVAAIKEHYGELLSDVVYRIECPALFDPAQPLTNTFTTTLIRWDDSHKHLTAEQSTALASELAVAFDAARAHAETVGMKHLPLEAQPQAARAAKALTLARDAGTEAERDAALTQAQRILADLAIYYLPTAVELPKMLNP